MIQNISTWGTLAATFATAIATVFLWRVTKILAIETKRMADVAAQPQIIANILPNQWATNHLDISVENTGSATAFDIEISFDPPLENGSARGDRPTPFQRISVLKPQQALQSYLSGVGEYMEKSFMVMISWKLQPDSENRQTLSYILNMADYAGVSYLGSRDPIVQLAEQVKKLREDWQYVASGSRRIRTEPFDASDRQREQDAISERFRRDADPSDSSETAE